MDKSKVDKMFNTFIWIICHVLYGEMSTNLKMHATG